MAYSGMRLIRIFFGVNDEFVLISTKAPDVLIELQLKKNNDARQNGKIINDPYAFLKECGYDVFIIGCQDDFTSAEAEQLDNLINVEFGDYQLRKKYIKILRHVQ